jgi:addiction module RelB/DinJ family antitoxin
MSSTTMVHVRVDEKVKARAAATLEKMGMSVSDAVRMMLIRVAAEKALPFEVRVPNAGPSRPCNPPTRKKASGSGPPRRYLKTWESENA